MKIRVIGVCLIIGVVAAGCEKKAVEGTVRLGPELMTFTPCGSDLPAWLHHDSLRARGWNEAQAFLDKQPECSLMTAPCKHQTVLIKGRAIVNTRPQNNPSPLGTGFGHLGQYPGEITFLEIIEAKSGTC